MSGSWIENFGESFELNLEIQKMTERKETEAILPAPNDQRTNT